MTRVAQALCCIIESLLERWRRAVRAQGARPNGSDALEQENKQYLVLYDVVRHWLLLIESVTSHGPGDGKRHGELRKLFATSSAGLMYVTAFPDRKTMDKYLATISWETEV